MAGPGAFTVPGPLLRRMLALHPNLLVIRRRYLGDLVLLSPLLRNLRLHWPQAPITVLVEPAYAAVLALNPDVDTVLTLPRGNEFTKHITEGTILSAHDDGGPSRNRGPTG